MHIPALPLSLLLSLMLLAAPALASKPQSASPLGPFDFTVHKLGAGGGPTLLVVGGIQGDEPGGFTAASLLASRYSFTKGQVWIVPNFNFLSIIHSSRGIHGDLNRKFAALDKSDPEYHAIAAIKPLILDPQVRLVLNLHDGSGFYRPTPLNAQLCPARWGQSVIIDQESIDIARQGGQESQNALGNLGNLARLVSAQVNDKLLNPLHVFHVKNTETRLGDVEMEKTLTYFAITHGKPAFGLEASKELNAAQRAYYHLVAVEAFLRQVGIEFKRDFTLEPQEVERAARAGASVTFYDNRIFLDLENVRKQINYLPIKKDDVLPFSTSNPLLTVAGGDQTYTIHHGNRALTTIKPQYFEFDTSLSGVTMRLDGQKKDVPFGRMVAVKEKFQVDAPEGFRVNVIGYNDPERDNESGLALKQTDLQSRFSLDEGGGIYRVEVYKGKKFAGMILVNFRGRPAGPVTAQAATSRVLVSPTNAGR